MASFVPRPDRPTVDILWVFAHPDDEAFCASGTMAWSASRNLRSACICATRGEAGGIRDPQLATRDTLGAVREHELRAAMTIAGLSDLRLLEFRDSGMEDTPENDDPRALIRQPRETLLAHLVGNIRDLRPTTVVTFGPDGIYGHPDHILIGALASEAVELAADPAWMPRLHEPWQASALYHATAPREQLVALADHPDQPLGAISGQARNNLGTPTADITHWLDVSPWIDVKRRVLASHATQFDPDAVLNPDPDTSLFQGLGAEMFVRRPLSWDPDLTADDPLSRAREEIGKQASVGAAERT